MRGKQAPKRKIDPEPIYNSTSLAKFINYIMLDGKKTLAQGIVYDAFDIIKEKTKKEPLEVFEAAIKNVSPTLEVKGRRIGGANYQVPIEVRGERRFNLASRWIIEISRGKKGTSMAQRLANELMQAANKEGDSMKKREDVHRMAEANKAFAHFA